MEQRVRTSSLEKQLITLGAFLCILGVSYSYFVHVKNTYYGVTSFDACVKAGFEVLTTYPEQCRMPGKRFVNEKQVRAPHVVQEELSVLEPAFKTAKYFFEGSPFMLVHGIGIIQEDSKAHTHKRQFNALPGEVYTDINHDGKEDTVFLLVDANDKRKQMYLTALFGLAEGYVGGSLTPTLPYSATSTLQIEDGAVRVTTGTSTKQSALFMIKDLLFYEKK